MLGVWSVIGALISTGIAYIFFGGIGTADANMFIYFFAPFIGAVLGFMAAQGEMEKQAEEKQKKLPTTDVIKIIRYVVRGALFSSIIVTLVCLSVIEIHTNDSFSVPLYWAILGAINGAIMGLIVGLMRARNSERH